MNLGTHTTLSLSYSFSKTSNSLSNCYPYGPTSSLVFTEPNPTFKLPFSLYFSPCLSSLYVIRKCIYNIIITWKWILKWKQILVFVMCCCCSLVLVVHLIVTNTVKPSKSHQFFKLIVETGNYLISSFIFLINSFLVHFISFLNTLLSSLFLFCFVFGVLSLSYFFSSLSLYHFFKGTHQDCFFSWCFKEEEIDLEFWDAKAAPTFQLEVVFPFL